VIEDLLVGLRAAVGADIYTYMCTVHTYIYTCVYIERERPIHTDVSTQVCGDRGLASGASGGGGGGYIYIYMYSIYIYIYIHTGACVNI